MTERGTILDIADKFSMVEANSKSSCCSPIMGVPWKKKKPTFAGLQTPSQAMKIYIPIFTTYVNLSRAGKKLICLFLNFLVVPAGTKSSVKSLNLYFVMMQPQLDPIVRSVKSAASSSVI